LEGWSSGLRL